MILWIVSCLPSLENKDFVIYADAHDDRPATRMVVSRNNAT